MDADSKTESNENAVPDQQSILDLEHDLRNLSAAMQSAVDVIRLDSGLSNDSSEMLKILDRQLDRLVQLAMDFSLRSDCRPSVPPRPSFAPNQGTSFGPDVSAAPGIRRHEILIVDDSRIVSYTLQVMLQRLGQNVRTAPNGFSAIASVIENFPNIVFSDLSMHGMNGYELAASIRSMPQGENIRLIAITGVESAEARQRSMESGFDEHFVKPVSYRELLGILGRATELIG